MTLEEVKRAVEADTEGRWNAMGVLDAVTARIEALEAENARLREALEPFAREADGRKSKGLLGGVIFTQDTLLTARRAREGGNNG